MARTTLLAPVFVALLSVVGLVSTPGVASAAPPDNPFEWSFSMSFGRGRLGVAVVSMTPELRTFFGAPDDRGLLISRVEPDSVADKAGLNVGDVLVSVDGMAVQSAVDVFEALADRRTGDAVDVVAIRKKKRVKKKVTLADDGPGPGFVTPFPAQDREGRLERELERTQRELDAIQRRLDRIDRFRDQGSRKTAPKKKAPKKKKKTPKRKKRPKSGPSKTRA